MTQPSRTQSPPAPSHPTGPSRSARRADRGVNANARLTAATGAALVVLLAIEGVTILRVRSLLTAHVFVGMLLVPPVIVKIGATTWRFVRYYRGAPAYRRKGPPPAVLRILGPFVAALTVVVFASGILVLLGPHAWRSQALLVHKASFVVWLGAMGIHVLGHARDTFRLAPLDWARRTRRQVTGASARQTILAVSLAVGVVLGAATIGAVGPYLHGLRFR